MLTPRWAPQFGSLVETRWLLIGLGILALGILLALRPQILRNEIPKSGAARVRFWSRFGVRVPPDSHPELLHVAVPAILILVGVMAVVGYFLD